MTRSCDREERALWAGMAPPGSPPNEHALPGDRPRWPRDRVVDQAHIRIEVRLDIEGKSVVGRTVHDVQVLNDGLESVPFDAMEMDIRSVEVDGTAAGFDYDGARVLVRLGSAAKRGQRLQIAIAYGATPRIGLYFVGPDEGYPEKPRQVWSQGQDEDNRHWFPCFDAPNQKMTSEMVATVPAPWYALSNGRLVSEKANRDGTRTFHWSQEKPHSTYLITLAAGEFERIDASKDGLTIDYFVETKDRADGERSFAGTPEMIAFFEGISGITYPWAKYSQIVVRDFVFGGMENTSATTMTENLLVDAKGARDFSAEYLVSHELAHMWWGDLLTCRDWGHGWLNESFATYAERLWDEHRHGLDEFRHGVIEDTDLYLGERYRRPIVSNVFRDPIDVFDRHLYEKGAAVLNTLRGVLGDDQFFRAIQRYCRDNQGRNVVTQALVDAIEAETGRNLEWFFDQWVYRPGHPVFKVGWAWDDGQKLATVSVKQTQKAENGTPVFRVPLTIDFTGPGRRRRAFNVEVTEAEHTFAFPLAAKPDLCRFDPYNRVLKEVDFEKSVGELRLQLRDDDDVAGRVFAAKALGKKGGREAEAALARAVAEDRFWGVQAAAARALGACRTTNARDALLENIRVRHPKARRGVVAALGEFRADEGVFEALKGPARRDASWFVEAEAHRSIGKLRLPGSFGALTAGMARVSFRNVVRQGCIDGFVELRDERAFEQLFAAAEYGTPFQTRGPALAAVAKLAEWFPPRRMELAERVAKSLRDPDFRVRVAAANALRSLNEPSQLAALDAMAERELDGRAVRAAREAAVVIRKGAAPNEEVAALRKNVEQLRDESVRLKDRLERLDARAGRPVGH